MPTNHDPVTANVRAEMARRNKTQTDVAELLGISQNGVSRRLRGETEWRILELRTLADDFGISLADLLSERAA